MQRTILIKLDKQIEKEKMKNKTQIKTLYVYEEPVLKIPMFTKQKQDWKTYEYILRSTLEPAMEDISKEDFEMVLARTVEKSNVDLGFLF